MEGETKDLHSKIPLILFFPKEKDHLNHQHIDLAKQKIIYDLYLKANQKEGEGNFFDVLKDQLSKKSTAYKNAMKGTNLVEVAKVVEAVVKAKEPEKEEKNEKFTSEDL